MRQMRIKMLAMIVAVAGLGIAAGTVGAEENDAKFPPLPKGVSSLGAIACDGYLYVYGGHAGKTHTYDTEGVLGTFQRLKLDGGTEWEKLPGGRILQGMNLACHNGKIYLVGGMEPRNAPGEPTDNHSVVDARRFDPKTGKWEELPPLPAARSSHDLVVVDDTLVVVGGWQMRGRGISSVWHDTALTLNLQDKNATWKQIPQPFKLRALTAAVVGKKVYILGGLGAEGTDKAVDVYDMESGEWSKGPELPGRDRAAFSPAACVLDGRLLLNTSAGPLFRLTEDGQGWEQVGETKQGRMVHRLIPHGDAVILVGGAGRGGNFADLELIKLTDPVPVASTEAGN